MLFIITLSYIRPIEEVKAHLDAHKAWLIKHIQTGNIIFAGPLKEGNGGLILAYGENVAIIQNMIAEDRFDIHHLTRFDIQTCNPAMRTNDFPAQWAAEALAIVI